MATVKIVLRKKKNQNGTSPLALRITKDRKTSFIHLGYHILEKDWDATTQRVRKSHSNAARLNNILMKKLADASNVVLEIDAQEKELSSNALKRKIKPSSDSMFFQADTYLLQLKKAGNFNVWQSRRSLIRIFKEFVLGTDAILDDLPLKSRSRKRISRQRILPGSDVPFRQIDVSLINRFKVYLKADRVISDMSIMNYMAMIQKVFLQAIADGVVEEKFLPFGKDKIRIKRPESQKIGLLREDVEKLETVELLHPSHQQVRDLWLISFYFAGMRVSDVLQLRWSDFRGGRLYYVMDKNSKPGSLKIPEKAERILERYAPLKAHAGDFVFSYLKGLQKLDDGFTLKRRIQFIVSNCDMLLKMRVAPKAGIEGKLTMHIARHTFATLAGDKIPIQMLQKLYRHSNVLTTIGYQANFVNKDADEALDAVLGE